MALAINPNPYVRNKRNTTQIMMELLIGLIVVWIASIVFYFTIGAGPDGLFAILNVLICVIACSGTELLFFIPKWKKEEGHNFKTLLLKVFHSFGFISGIILALTLPVMTNNNPLIHIINLIITCVISVGVLKMLFGGFGHNIFNVALVGRVIAGECFGSSFVYGHKALSGRIDVISGSTILSNWANEGWTIGTGLGKNVNLLDYLFGNYFGAIGETFTLIILIVGVLYIVRRVIDWKLPVFYLATCAITALIVGAINNTDVITFTLAQLMTGGIMFGAVFCLTDPVTAPTNPLAKILYAVFAGFLTMLIRFKGASAEGVALAILTANMLAPFIANLYSGKTTTNLPKKIGITGGACALMILISCSYSGVVTHYNPATEYKTNVTQLETNKYNVKVDYLNAYSPIDMNVIIDAENRLVMEVEIIPDNTGASGGFGDYFFGLVNSPADSYHYNQNGLNKLEGLKSEIFTFTNGISFDVFRKYDFTYFDKAKYTDYNDLSSDIIGCGSTYTVSAYVFGINALIDVVEGA